MTTYIASPGSPAAKIRSAVANDQPINESFELDCKAGDRAFRVHGGRIGRRLRDQPVFLRFKRGVEHREVLLGSGFVLPFMPRPVFAAIIAFYGTR